MQYTVVQKSANTAEAMDSASKMPSIVHQGISTPCATSHVKIKTQRYSDEQDDGAYGLFLGPSSNAAGCFWFWVVSEVMSEFSLPGMADREKKTRTSNPDVGYLKD